MLLLPNHFFQMIPIQLILSHYQYYEHPNENRSVLFLFLFHPLLSIFVSFSQSIPRKFLSFLITFTDCFVICTCKHSGFFITQAWIIYRGCLRLSSHCFSFAGKYFLSSNHFTICFNKSIFYDLVLFMIKIVSQKDKSLS